MGARARDRERGSVSREDYRHADRDYRERSSADRDYSSGRDFYRDRDRDFGEIVFLEREGEMLAHFQAIILRSFATRDSFLRGLILSQF